MGAEPTSQLPAAELYSLLSLQYVSSSQLSSSRRVIQTAKLEPAEKNPVLRMHLVDELQVQVKLRTNSCKGRKVTRKRRRRASLPSHISVLVRGRINFLTTDLAYTSVDMPFALPLYFLSPITPFIGR